MDSNILVTESTPPINKKIIFTKQPYKGIREILAIIFWLMLLTKLFVIDFDVIILDNIAPNYTWLLNYKFFFIIIVISFSLAIFRNKQILFWSLYIFFYPFVILIWKIPSFLYKQKNWNFIFAFFNAFISFFKSFKYLFIQSTLFLIALALILNTSNKIAISIGIILLFILTILAYANRIISIFKPANIFQSYKKFFIAIRKHFSALFSIDDEMKGLKIEQYGEKQREKWSTNLQYSMIFNRMCLFSSKKLRNYQRSGYNVAFYAISVIMLIFFTIITFAGINYGVYKISFSQFKFSGTPDFFLFIYYSFSHYLNNSIQELIPITSLSQSLLMIESIFSIMLLIILVSLLFNYKNQKNVEEISNAIKDIEQEGKSMEVFIRDEYRLNIDDALKEINRLKLNLANFLLWLTNNIK